MLIPDRVYQMDAIEGLRRLDSESVDLIVTDPPYNIASGSKLTVRHGRLISTKEAWGAWDTFDPGEYDAFIGRVLDESFRVLKPGGALYMFTAREDNGFFVREAVRRGFTYRNQLALIRRCPLPSMAKKNWRSAFELALYVTKGKPKTFNFLSQPECVNVSYYLPTHKHTDHPTEKPFDAIRRIVLVSSNLGDLVLDPFLGSGTTAVAAKETGRRFIGFDTSDEYVRMARVRLARTTSQSNTAASHKEAA
jgi:DNA modification methylase